MRIKDKIHTIRGRQVILDRDLAEMYEVKTRALNQAVKRNKERFPRNFYFQLTEQEEDDLKSQNVTLENLRSQTVTSKNSMFQNGTSRFFLNL